MRGFPGGRSTGCASAGRPASRANMSSAAVAANTVGARGFGSRTFSGGSIQERYGSGINIHVGGLSGVAFDSVGFDAPISCLAGKALRSEVKISNGRFVPSAICGSRGACSVDRRRMDRCGSGLLATNRHRPICSGRRLRQVRSYSQVRYSSVRSGLLGSIAERQPSRGPATDAAHSRTSRPNTLIWLRASSGSAAAARRRLIVKSQFQLLER